MPPTRETVGRRVAPIHYQPVLPVTPRRSAIEALVAGFGWRPSTARAKLNPAHPACPYTLAGRMNEVLVGAGHATRAAALTLLVDLGGVPADARAFDRLELEEQELDGRENEAQLAHRIALANGDRDVARRSWDTARRLYLRYVNLAAPLLLDHANVPRRVSDDRAGRGREAPDRLTVLHPVDAREGVTPEVSGGVARQGVHGGAGARGRRCRADGGCPRPDPGDAQPQERQTYDNITSVMKLPKGMEKHEVAAYVRVKDREPEATGTDTPPDPEYAEEEDDDLPF